MRVKKIMLLLMLCTNVCFAELVDTTRTSILVNDTNRNDPIKMKQAFAQIMANNTGEKITDILQNSLFNSINIRSKIKRFYFEKVDIKYLKNKQSPKYWFHIVVDEKVIQKISKDAGFSLLEKNRNKIMLWGAVEDNTLNSRLLDVQILNNDPNEMPQKTHYIYDDESAMYWASRWAQSLGLVLEYPTIDELDMLAVEPISIKSLSNDAHNQTQSRYQLDHSLLIFIKRDPQNIKIRSGYITDQHNTAMRHFNDNQLEEGEIMYSTMQDVAENYATQNKIPFDSLQKQMLRFVIDDLNHFDQVSDILSYLTNLAIVKSHQIQSASNSRLVLNVEVIVTTDTLLTVFEEDGILWHQPNISNQLFFKFAQQ